jgi:hypothetical protein
VVERWLASVRPWVQTPVHSGSSREVCCPGELSQPTNCRSWMEWPWVDAGQAKVIVEGNQKEIAPEWHHTIKYYCKEITELKPWF